MTYRLPLLRHGFVLCSDSTTGDCGDQRVDLMAFFFQEAARLAEQSVGDPDAFMLIHGANRSRRGRRRRSGGRLAARGVSRRARR